MMERFDAKPEYTRRELIRAMIGCTALSASVSAMVLLGIMANYQLSMAPADFYDTVLNASVWPLMLPGILATGVVVATVWDVWLYRPSLVDRIVISVIVCLLHIVAATFYWSWVLSALVRSPRRASSPRP